MQQRGLGDRAFAELVGVDRSTVANWRIGRRRPDNRSLDAILRVTEGAVTPNDFFAVQAAFDHAAREKECDARSS
jgi:DNA-binding transcriptional regulator YdaS (Cro superfamily)